MRRRAGAEAPARGSSADAMTCPMVGHAATNTSAIVPTLSNGGTRISVAGNPTTSAVVAPASGPSTGLEAPDPTMKSPAS
jgi:hypothetical protein